MIAQPTHSPPTAHPAPVGPAHPRALSTPVPLPDAFAWCRAITRDRARNFYYGLRLTPEPRRSHLFAIYAWMRIADDIVDDPTNDPHTATARLDRFWLRTQHALDHPHDHGSLTPDGDSHPLLWPALAHAARAHRLDINLFHHVIEGLHDDLAATTLRTDDDLRRYCYRVAGTVGLLCVSVWGLRPGVDPQLAATLAIDRGHAFQLTNILRDLREDLALSPPRLYLPLDTCRDAGLIDAAQPDQSGRDRAIAALLAWSPAGPCAHLVRRYAALARDAFTRSAPLDELIAPDCRPVLHAMTRIYSGILAKIEAQPALAVAPRRASLSAAHKARIALSAGWATRLLALRRAILGDHPSARP